MMNDCRTYWIVIDGRVSGEEINRMSPIELSPTEAGENASLFTAYTDQSGLIGLLRHLHARGHAIRSITCADGEGA